MRGTLNRTIAGVVLLTLVVLRAPFLWAGFSPPRPEVAAIVVKMEAAYAQVEEYQTGTEVTEYREGRVVGMKRFRYTFKKPNRLRIDMESPHRGMVLAYPDEGGKVAVRPGGLGSFLKLHLATNSALLQSSAGQRIDQTDLGLLIRHIRTSIAARSSEEIRVTVKEGRVIIQVLAKDHFRAGVMTLYRFTIDTASWLPAEVEELTPEGVPQRTVVFRNLRIVHDIPDSFFRIDGGN